MNFIRNESAQKLRGGYYTPIDLATYVTRWTLEKNPKALLEPSCGDGIFIQALSDLKLADGLTLTGFEVLEEEAVKARNRCRDGSSLSWSVLGEDFLGWAIGKMLGRRPLFDAVVGNPPFIRYQYLAAGVAAEGRSHLQDSGAPIYQAYECLGPFCVGIHRPAETRRPSGNDYPLRNHSCGSRSVAQNVPRHIRAVGC